MSNDWAKVKGLSSFERDPVSRALINTNTDAYNEYMDRREKDKHKKLEIAKLKTEVSELKSLVKQLMDKLDG